MLTAIDLNKRVEFISKYDIEEPKTIFLLKLLTVFEMMEYSDLDESERMLDFICDCVAEVKGVEDKREFIKSMEMKVIAELFQKCIEINKLTDEDKKKF